eukprot:2524378-Prymnesium_polylepis.1
MADALDDELAAFEAELQGAAAEGAAEGAAEAAPSAGPRAPKVISAAPVRSAAPVTNTVGMPTVGGPRVPVSEWQAPDQLASAIQSEFPDAQMPELGKQPGTLERSLKQDESAGGASSQPKPSLPVAVSGASSSSAMMPPSMAKAPARPAAPAAPAAPAGQAA